MIVNGSAHQLPLPSGSAHMVVTSPPYFNAREYSQWDTYEAYLADMDRAWCECFRVLCEGGRIAVVISQGYGRPASNGGYRLIGDDTTRGLIRAGFEIRGHVIWNKKVFGGSGLSRLGGTAWGSWLSASNPSLRDMHELIIVGHKEQSARRVVGKSTIDKDTFLMATGSVWSIPPSAPSRVWHPAPFPDEIPRRLIELYTFEGDLVVDPFSGSGTTERVAIGLRRRAIGIEISLAYCRRSGERLPQPHLFARAVVAGSPDDLDWPRALAERLEQAAKLVPDGDPLGEEIARMVAEVRSRH